MKIILTANEIIQIVTDKIVGIVDVDFDCADPKITVNLEVNTNGLHGDSNDIVNAICEVK